jgi:hypothetical protein
MLIPTLSPSIIPVLHLKVQFIFRSIRLYTNGINNSSHLSFSIHCSASSGLSNILSQLFSSPFTSSTAINLSPFKLLCLRIWPRRTITFIRFQCDHISSLYAGINSDHIPMRISSCLRPELALKSTKKLQTIGDLQHYKRRFSRKKNRDLVIIPAFKILNTFIKIISETGKWYPSGYVSNPKMKWVILC